MNISLKDWDELISYANSVCDHLKENGINAKPVSYAIYNGDKGIKIQLFDANNKFFNEYCSGIGSYSEMMAGINHCYNRIIYGRS